MSESTSFDCFCIVEVMGRKVVAGRVTEQVIAGQGFIRVDVPATADQPAFTQMFGPGSIYAITPTTEEIAKAFVARNVGAPIHPYQLALPEPVHHEMDDEDWNR
jgi:hypothetical protein